MHIPDDNINMNFTYNIKVVKWIGVAQCEHKPVLAVKNWTTSNCSTMGLKAKQNNSYI
jgi:hypothetical protein